MCIFCKIINHEIPAKVVYEDDDYLAILDISQVTLGHTIVMPKKHYATVLDMDSQAFQAYMAVVLKVTKLIQAKTHCLGINILNNTNEVAGQTVMHVHYHIIPRYSKQDNITINFKENANPNLDEVLKLLNN